MNGTIDAVIDVLWGPGPISAIQDAIGPDWAWLLRPISYLGDTFMIVLVFAVVFWLRGRGQAYGVVGAVIVVAIIDLILWLSLGVDRPDDPRIIVRAPEPTVPSFPSGHTAVAVTLWGTLAAFRLIPVSIAVMIGIGVGISRLYLGVHFVGDVLGAWLIGPAVVVLYQRFWPAIRDWFGRRSFRVIAGLCLVAPLVTLPAITFSQRGWQILAATSAAAVALPVEYRRMRYSPPMTPVRWKVALVILGLTGLAAGALVLLALPLTNWIAYAAAFAVLWIVLIYPVVVSRLGLAGPSMPLDMSGPDGSSGMAPNRSA